MSSYGEQGAGRGKNGDKPRKAVVMVRIVAPTVEAMHRVGQAIGTHAMPGDLVMLSGPLGAGKTTMTQGIARGLGVSGHVSSPTFVIAQIHQGRFDLVHVDAYRLESMDELDALDLDTSLDESLTVVEWGTGKVESLASSRLEIDIARPLGGADSSTDLAADEPRTLTLNPVGPRAEALARSVVDAVGDLVETAE
ncbi:tRNA (adenosine(37)-N6)-threonylcarbamoyltransferase complex ATPase subunit type 1 TsaE [Trueperella bialowiezensis]|uniref:tRNA threonylcarbamoyladenosine biosynthesis protein TsaE n=1 Tax=Trueperella bialowiezensis TaxID=312285 RepID=A0A3S4X4Y7_9ACTO|nr:tRNA (adenosine(37)-N6)-threonylcarbamoyltransferase complex ATPase subunit type 1 TsaE [Trueperella bialowiezensis]VEI12805.1 ADP-binding protein [Trueperella bialowiezensis]